jgi:hypothetical protein
MMDYECGTVGGMRIGRGNRSTRRKPAPVPLCPLQVPHDLTWARSRRLTAWGLATVRRPTETSWKSRETSCWTSSADSVTAPIVGLVYVLMFAVRKSNKSRRPGFSPRSRDVNRVSLWIIRFHVPFPVPSSASHRPTRRCVVSTLTASLNNQLKTIKLPPCSKILLE